MGRGKVCSFAELISVHEKYSVVYMQCIYMAKTVYLWIIMVRGRYTSLSQSGCKDRRYNRLDIRKGIDMDHQAWAEKELARREELAWQI